MDFLSRSSWRYILLDSRLTTCKGELSARNTASPSTKQFYTSKGVRLLLAHTKIQEICFHFQEEFKYVKRLRVNFSVKTSCGKIYENSVLYKAAIGTKERVAFQHLRSKQVYQHFSPVEVEGLVQQHMQHLAQLDLTGRQYEHLFTSFTNKCFAQKRKEKQWRMNQFSQTLLKNFKQFDSIANILSKY